MKKLIHNCVYYALESEMYTGFWYTYKGKIYKDYKIMVDTEGTEKAMGDPVGKRNTQRT
jgi:hypothetical protein